MKKLFTLPILLMFFFCSTSSKAQVIFSEKFDAPSSFPTGWTIANVDKKTPGKADFVTDAWVNLEVEAGKYAAVSTSWYDPIGQSNDWMWTPPITLLLVSL